MTMTIGQKLPKSGYTAPKLVVYGGMAALTASGSGSQSEAGNQGSKKRQ